MWQIARAKYTDAEAISAIEDSGGIDIEGVNPVMCAVHATHQPTKDAKLGVVLGGANSYPGIWLGQATPDVTNYAFMGAGNATLFNAPAGGSFAFRIGNANKMKLHASGGFAIGDSYYATDPGTDDVSIEKDLSIRATTATRPLDINSNIMRLRSAYTPATAGSAGYQGDLCWDADYFYICVATNTWERTPHAWDTNTFTDAHKTKLESGLTQFMWAWVNWDDGNSSHQPLGSLPANAFVVRTFLHITTQFDDTVCVVSVGTTGDPDAYIQNYTLSAIAAGVKDDVVWGVNRGYRSGADGTVQTTLLTMGGDGTQGAALVGIEYMVVGANS